MIFFFSPLQLEFMAGLQSRLQVLWEERELVLSEAREWAKRGEELEAMVRDLCKPNEFERYMMFIGDLEKVVSLLLCLSSRLARVQNAMNRMDGNTDAEEKVSDNKGIEFVWFTSFQVQLCSAHLSDSLFSSLVVHYPNQPLPRQCLCPRIGCVPVAEAEQSRFLVRTRAQCWSRGVQSEPCNWVLGGNSKTLRGSKPEGWLLDPWGSPCGVAPNLCFTGLFEGLFLHW